MPELFAKTYNEQLREITELYRNSAQPWPATSRQIAIWAINVAEASQPTEYRPRQPR